MVGRFFDRIQDGSIGIYATSNDDPLAKRYSMNNNDLFDIVNKSDTTMRVEARVQQSHSSNNFLGALVSQDREIVYWVNNTRPLP